MRTTFRIDRQIDKALLKKEINGERKDPDKEDREFDKQAGDVFQEEKRIV